MSIDPYPWNHAAPLPASLVPLFKVDWTDYYRKRGRGNGNFTPIVLSGNLDNPNRTKPFVRRQAAI